ncbi:MAG: hypothetical protein LUE64_03200 [Candidatus Gastranaerophilales bacterium]|nr:hypothetical protein [Candidatus Gastranaerophilales bacterium]
MSKIWAGEILDILDKNSDKRNVRGYKICTVKSVSPFVFTYNDIDIGTQEGDVIYIHPLFISSAISQDENTLLDAQAFTSSTAYNSPSFSAVIEGTMPAFLKEFYLFYKEWQSVFLLSVGDLIAVYELGRGKYLVLQKVIKDVEEDE